MSAYILLVRLYTNISPTKYNATTIIDNHGFMNASKAANIAKKNIPPKMYPIIILT